MIQSLAGPLDLVNRDPNALYGKGLRDLPHCVNVNAMPVTAVDLELRDVAGNPDDP